MIDPTDHGFKTDHDNRKHALLSSSKAHIWMHCAGAPALWKRCPESPDSVHASEGRKVAGVVESILKAGGGPLPVEYIEAQTYLDVCAAEVARYPDPIGQAECVHLTPHLAASNPNRGGTPDFLVVDRKATGLSIVDLKWGEGIKVEAVANAQLLEYFDGADRLTTAKGWRLPDSAPVRLIIVQPRWRDEADRIRVWTMPAKEARALVRGHLAQANLISEAFRLGGSLPRNPGEHCRFCSAAGICPEKRDRALAALSDLDAPPQVAPAAPAKPADLTPAQLSRVLAMADEVREWLSSVEAFAMSAILRGESVPGWKVVRGRAGNRAWDDTKEAEIAKALKKQGVDPYAAKLISPAAAEKAGADLSKLSTLVSRADGKPAIAPESDKRAAYDSAAALPALSVDVPDPTA